ncbi:OsmC family protein [Tissierella sp. Yu-01]|uniref:OsmC family protein n=1 Tax=Tissierella sp. Yu-01 TaxID=3035694 RepID=UPI00240DD66A|nr:OsmC family protein [Tissierella sp. Yu-01]WFA09089.1 OsmC family protein [Tissierella sp. Yu-01]
MSLTKLSGKLSGNMAFEMDLNGHKLITDGAPEIGGQGLGYRPKTLLLAGLIGCTGIDVMMITRKMQIEFEDVNIEVETDTTEEDPKVYKYIKMVYRFKGKNLPFDKIKRAVDLSMEKYCGVSAMLSKAAPITYEILIEE